MSFNNSSQGDVSSFQRKMIEEPGAYHKLHNCHMEVVHRPDEPATASDSHSEEVQPHNEQQNSYPQPSVRRIANTAIELAFE